MLPLQDAAIANAEEASEEDDELERLFNKVGQLAVGWWYVHVEWVVVGVCRTGGWAGAEAWSGAERWLAQRVVLCWQTWKEQRQLAVPPAHTSQAPPGDPPAAEPAEERQGAERGGAQEGRGGLLGQDGGRGGARPARF